jgi:cytochrome c5
MVALAQTLGRRKEGGAMKRVKRILKWSGVVLLVLLLAVAAFGGVEVAMFTHSAAKVYDVPVPPLTRSADAAVLARGKHLAEATAGCATADCHGADLGGGKAMDAGPIGTIVAPNITQGGKGAEYSDGELARLISHGLKRDGRSVRFMPANDFCWLSDDDVTALVSFVRTVPPVARPSKESSIGVLAKVLDRLGMIPIDIARHIDHEHRLSAPPAAPTAQYGAFLSRSCNACHGDTFSGGRIPGAPASMAVPANLTPHETGLGKWQYADFKKVLETGMRPDGRKLDPMMPYEALSKLNDTEKQALWAFLQALPPKPHGNR